MFGLGSRMGRAALTSDLRRQIVIKPRSVRQVKRYLKEPLSLCSAVIYFSEKDDTPYLLDPEGGISSGGRFRLTENWQLSADRLERIVIVTSEACPADEVDVADEGHPDL
jgi:hypothetical protein